MAGAFLLFLRLIRRRIYDEFTLVWSMNSVDGNKHITIDGIDLIVQFTCVWPVNRCVYVQFSYRDGHIYKFYLTERILMESFPSMYM